MNILPDMWLSTVYNDGHVQGSEAGPVVYLRSGIGCPLVNYNELASRWGTSKTSSMATELVKGKTVQKVLQMTDKAVCEALDGFLR